MPRLRLALAILSLTLSLCLCGLWVRSYWKLDGLYYTHNRTLRGIAINSGLLEWVWATNRGFADGPSWSITPALPASRNLQIARGMPGAWGRDLIGFGAGGWSSPASAAGVVQCPVWLPVLLTLIPPALWLRRRRKAQSHGFPIVQGSPNSSHRVRGEQT